VSAPEHPASKATPSTAEGFWRRVDRSGGVDACWPWGGPINHGWGYGRYRVKETPERAAHRIAWVLTHRPIPDGLHVLHNCDTPLCCNPAHLRLGTHPENIADRDRKGRNATGERHGAARLTAAQVAEIRRLLDEGETQEAVAARFGTSQQHVSKIKRRVIWRNA
jgi:hypothetical protein